VNMRMERSTEYPRRVPERALLATSVAGEMVSRPCARRRHIPPHSTGLRAAEIPQGRSVSIICRSGHLSPARPLPWWGRLAALNVTDAFSS